MTDVEAIHGGTSALREFLTASLWFTVEFTGEPVMSGPVPRRAEPPHRWTTGAFYDGVYVFWISDGKIALQAYAQGD